MLKPFAVAFAATMYLYANATAAEPLSRDDVQRFVQPLVDAGRVDGISVGVLQNGQRTTVHLGVRDAAGQTADDQTLYEIGSISKVFTSLLLADAVVRGQVELRAPVAVAGATNLTLPRYEEQPIRWIHLATHRSGLPRLAENMAMRDPNDPYSDYTSKEAIEFLKTYRLTRAPGSRHEYSNFGASLLGWCLAHQLDKSYDHLLRDRITAPLKMNDTTVTPRAEDTPRIAQGHSAVGVAAIRWNFNDLPGAGGIVSSTDDMLRFAAAQLDPPPGELGQAIELAWKQHSPATADAMAMGLGWMIARDGQTRWHNGQTGGYHTMLMINRPLKTAVVVLSNTASDQVDRVAELLVQKAAGMDVQPPTYQTEVAVSAETLDRLTGQYQLAPQVIITITRQEAQLMVQLTGQPALPVYAKSPSEWFYKAVDARLTFELPETGPATKVTLHQNGLDLPASRK